MSQFGLYISDGDQLHKCYLTPKEDRDIQVGNDLFDTVTFPRLQKPFTISWDGYKCSVGEDTFLPSSHLSIFTDKKKLELYLVDMNSTSVFDTSLKEVITFGGNKYDDIQIESTRSDFVLFQNKENTNTYLLEVNRGEVYHNYKRIQEQTEVELGDILFTAGWMITLGADDVKVTGVNDRLQSQLVSLVAPESNYSKEYPDYHRSPRIIYREPTEQQTIAKPPNKPSKPSEQLARTIIPPLVMITALGIVSIFQPRGIYIIVMLSMTVATVVLSVTSYIKNVKKYRRDTKERIRSYKAYLKRKTKELYEVGEEHRHALKYHYPDVLEMDEMVKKVTPRIYEKTMYHHDFLRFRVGLGEVESSYEIEFNEEEFTQDEDELIDQARELRYQFDGLENVPITTSLMKGPVGYIGQRELVLEQLQLLVTQIGLFHSYHDVEFITIFPEEEKPKWDWMRWLPHASLKNVNVRGFVYHERSRDQVLHSLYQILKERELVLEEKGNKKEKTYFIPHYVILITDEKIVLDHTIMEFFDKDPSELGVSLVFVQDVLESLPEHVRTVIDIRDAKLGNILLEEEELVNTAFTLDHFPKRYKRDSISRGLASLNHLQSLKSSIPETVTFLEMYGIEKVEDFHLKMRWKQNETYKSMAVPLGLRGKDDLVYLNLHEKAHGPHGLVAGTTGSGKSEIIQSYIISLAVNFHPYEIGFLLIDYKGGGMANLFNDLPHLLGTITNLDGAASMRALASIKAELQKRQRLFGEHDVNHINQYQKLFKQGEASEPMPHLFLISDEFAELKSEQPDFMKELVSTARIGRSLGIHLILATQKPSGVVDDQIWSNSKFKLALKVQNASDSNEILKTPDAAEITLPGRSYLQVGNNEIYELFQSAWSGADYVPEKEDQAHIDTTIYAINDLGQYDILTEDLSELDHKDEVEKTITELEAVIDYVGEYTEQAGIERLPSPWLPPLPDRLYLEDYHSIDYKEEWKKEKSALQVIVGLLDQPELQAQNPVTVDLTKDGHVAVYSSPGYGKSTFLQTLFMDLSRIHNPEHLHVYLFDFGTNGLLPLRNYPHVADTMMIDEVVKVAKFTRMLTDLIKERKDKLSSKGVATIGMYEQASGETIPNIVIMIDNYDAVREADFAEDFERVITQIAREGGSIGIHLVITAGRQNAMRIPLSSNIKNQISLYLIDYTESRAIVGRTELTIEELAGRGLMKLEDPTLFQTFLPTKGESSLDVIEEIRATGEEMDEVWEGERPEGIPMMPEGAIEFAKFKENKRTKDLVKQNLLPLGLEFEEVKPLALDPTKYNFLTVVSDRKDGLDQLTKAMAQSMSMLNEGYYTILVDSNDQALAEVGNQLNAYVSKTDSIVKMKDELTSEINNRLGGEAEQNKWLVMIKDLKDFESRSNLKEDELLLLLEEGLSVGIHFIVCGEYGFIGSSYDPVPKFVRRQSTIGLMTMKLGDQSIFDQPFIRKEKYPSPYECYYVMDHEHIKLKIPE